MISSLRLFISAAAWLVILFAENSALAAAHEYKKTFAGSYFGCGVLLESGHLECWGDIDQRVYQPPESIVDPDQIVFGHSNACALYDKKVTCWGYNISRIPSDLTGVTEIAYLTNTFCAVFESGTLKCWDDMGRENSIVENIPPISPVHHVAIGDSFACANYGDGRKLTCWGDEAATEMELVGRWVDNISISSKTLCVSRSSEYTEDRRVYLIQCEKKGTRGLSQPLTSLVELKNFVLNSEMICAIKIDDYLFCQPLSGSTKIPNIKKVNHISSMGNTICVVRKNDHLRQCFGPDTSSGVTATALESSLDIVDFTATGTGFCYLLKDGFLNCVGLWAYMEDLVPTHLMNAKKIMARNGSICVLFEDQSLDCLGYLGMNLPSLKQVSHLSEYGRSICAIHNEADATNKLTCWGDNEHGQITVPTTLGPVSTVTVGITNTCASPISNPSIVQCWGDSPAQFSYPGKQVKEISVGLTSVCTLFNNGDVTCEKTHANWPFPTPNNLGKVKRLLGGRWFHCAYNEANELKCWGLMGSGPAQGEVEVPASLKQGYPIIKLSSERDGICALTKEFIQCVGDHTSPLIYFNKR